MMGRFVRERYPLLVLATILVVTLALLLIRGANGIGLLDLGRPGWEHGTTGAGSGVAGLSSGSAIGETGVPDALGAPGGYQAIDRSQTTGGDTTGARPTSVQPPGGQTTAGKTANSQSTGGQTTGSPISGAEPTGGNTTEVQPPGGQTTDGGIAGGQTAGAQTPGDQRIGGGTTGGQTPGDQQIGGDGGWGDDDGRPVSEGVATPELPSGLLVVIGLISLLGIGWLNARRRDAFNRT